VPIATAITATTRAFLLQFFVSSANVPAVDTCSAAFPLASFTSSEKTHYAIYRAIPGDMLYLVTKCHISMLAGKRSTSQNWSIRLRIFLLSTSRANDQTAPLGRFGRCSDALGPTPAQVRADQPGALAKPLSRMGQGIVRPLVSGNGFGRRFGSQFGSGNLTDEGGEKALSFLLHI